MFPYFYIIFTLNYPGVQLPGNQKYIILVLFILSQELITNSQTTPTAALPAAFKLAKQHPWIMCLSNSG